MLCFRGGEFVAASLNLFMKALVTEVLVADLLFRRRRRLHDHDCDRKGVNGTGINEVRGLIEGYIRDIYGMRQQIQYNYVIAEPGIRELFVFSFER